MPPAAPRAPGAPGRAQLEAMVKLVHDVTGRPLNEIRTDLEYTRDPQRTIVRIMEGEFLKGTPRELGVGVGGGNRDGNGEGGGWAAVNQRAGGAGGMGMSGNADGNAVQMLDPRPSAPLLPPPVVHNWPWRESERERETESRSPEKKNVPMQVIDLCDSEEEDESPPAPPAPPPSLPQPQRATQMQPSPETWQRGPAAEQPAAAAASSSRWTRTRRPAGEPRAPPPLPLLSAPFEPAERPAPHHRAAESSSAAAPPASSSDAWTTPVRARPPPPPAMPASRHHVDTWGGPATAPPVRHHVPAAPPPSPPPPQPVFSASPLFRYQGSESPSPPLLSPERPKPRVVTHASYRVDPSSPATLAAAAPLPSSSPERPKPKPKPRVVTHANFRVDPSPAAAPPPPPPVFKTPVAGKRQKLDVISIDSDSSPDSGGPAAAPRSAVSVPNTDSIPRRARRDRQSSYSSPTKDQEPVLSTATRSLLQEFGDEARGNSDDDDGELVVSASGSAGKKRKKKAPVKSVKTKAAPGKRKTKPPEVAVEEEAAAAAAKKSTRLTDAEKAQRAAEKEAAKEAVKLQRQQEREAKAAERDAAKAQKNREREAKELEKKQEQELALANKLRMSRKDSVQEMIVDMSQHLKDSATGQSLARFLVGLGCEVNTTWYPTLPEGTQREWRVAKWRRKVTSEWDERRALFVPLPAMKVTDECHVLVYLTAQEFWQLAEGAEEARLAEHVQLASGFSPRMQDVKVLYLLEGVEAFVRGNRNNRNREYQNRVRAALGEGASIPADAEILDEDVLQDALLELQIVHGCLVHHTASGVESAEWISKFTTDISTIPYKNSRSAIGAAGFCTDAGQLRVGIGKADTFRRMLEEIHRVTPSAAEAVVRVYPDVRALVEAFAGYGEEMLADLPISTTRGGRTTDKTVGQSISRRICGVFMNRDPDSVEI